MRNREETEVGAVLMFITLAATRWESGQQQGQPHPIRLPQNNEKPNPVNTALQSIIICGFLYS